MLRRATVSGDGPAILSGATAGLRRWVVHESGSVEGSVLARVEPSPLDDFLAAIGGHVVAVDRALARRAAELRADHTGLRLPDALSLATALAGAAQLLTLDRRLQRIAAREPPG